MKVTNEMVVDHTGEWHKQAEHLFLAKNVKDLESKQIVETRRLLTKEEKETIVKRLNVYPFR